MKINAVDRGWTSANRNYMLSIISIVVFSLTMSCTEEECCVMPEPVCYTFDIRQCKTDLFADEVSETDTQSERESQMLKWLSNQGLATLDVELTVGFHEMVCEACDMCPQGDRYQIRLNESLTDEQIETFRLLNLEEVTCQG